MFKIFNCVLLICAFSSCAQKLNIVTENWPPYNYLDEHGEIKGKSTQALKQILAMAEIEYELEIKPWARSLQTAIKNKNTLIYSIYKTEERQDYFHWFCPILKPAPMHFYKLIDNKKVKFKNLEQAKKFTIGINRGDWIHTHLLNLGFEENKQLDVAAETEVNFKKLIAGRVDLLINSEEGMKRSLNSRKLPLNSVVKLMTLDLSNKAEICFALNKTSSPELVNKIKQAFAKYRSIKGR